MIQIDPSGSPNNQEEWEEGNERTVTLELTAFQLQTVINVLVEARGAFVRDQILVHGQALKDVSKAVAALTAVLERAAAIQEQARLRQIS